MASDSRSSITTATTSDTGRITTLTTYPDFCTELEQRSVFLYDRSDRLANLRLAAASIDRQIYVDKLADFYFVFCTLEKELGKRRNHECIKRLLPEEVMRKKAFEEDLEYFLGSGWEEKIKPSQEARSYCEHIVMLSEVNPPMLIA